MPIKFYNPTSPGRRAGSVLDYNSVITKDRPEKSLTVGKRRASGRNHHGVITAKHRGGGNKRLYRLVDFKRARPGVTAVVETIEYDPNRSANIALIRYIDGQRAYIIAPDGVKVGQSLVNKEDAALEPGNVLPLGKLPLNTFVHNVEIKPGKGAQIARAAGTQCEIVAREGDMVHLKLPSGEIRMVSGLCKAVIGRVGNVDFNKVVSGSAGRSRWLGKRPKVRGVAMNPIDHPMGGGEGKTSGGGHPVSPWGKKAKGKKTRNNKRTDKFIVKHRPKNKA